MIQDYPFFTLTHFLKRNNMQQYHAISIILAILVFAIIGLIGFLSYILREQNGSEYKYSFHKFQLWIWTLTICPLFALNWGYTTFNPVINLTSLILLGISSASLLTGIIITQINLNNQIEKRLKNSTINFSPLKIESTSSRGFFIDILTDDFGQLSVPRLQNFVFTLLYIVIYTVYFFSNGMEYINWDKDSTPFVLMGISAGTYLFGKGLLK